MIDTTYISKVIDQLNSLRGRGNPSGTKVI